VSPRRVALLLALAAGLEAPSARAQSPIGPEDGKPAPRLRVVHRTLIGGRINPLGAIVDTRVGIRVRLLDGGSPLTNDSFVGVGTQVSLAPTYARAGAYFEVQPIAALNFSAGYEGMGWFGSFGQLQTFPTTTVDWSDTANKLRTDAGLGAATFARVAWVQGLAQVKLSVVVVRDTFRVTYTDVAAPPDRVSFYDAITDILSPTHGFHVVNDADIVVLPDDHWIAGARHTLTHVVFDPDAGYSPTHRVGPIVGYKFFDRPGAAFNQPTLILLSQWWLSHPYRTGADVTVALPLIALAFTFTGDLGRVR